MQNPNLSLIEDARKLLSGYKSHDFKLKNLARDLNLPVENLIDAFGDETGLVEAVLNYEQYHLENIFSEVDLSGGNAIEGLLRVSKEISQKFGNILPSINFDLRSEFPEVRQRFVEKRVDFVNLKIKSNIEIGIEQGLYRHDLSPELISRIYMSRLIDLHNPDFFPNNSISFELLFDVLFDTFIRGISTDAGIKYYEQKIKCMKFTS
jgi:TetR/AcrR family transcriptional regulator, cholesterol catabolism regulator